MSSEMFSYTQPCPILESLIPYFRLLLTYSHLFLEREVYQQPVNISQSICIFAYCKSILTILEIVPGCFPNNHVFMRRNSLVV